MAQPGGDLPETLPSIEEGSPKESPPKDSPPKKSSDVQTPIPFVPPTWIPPSVPESPPKPPTSKNAPLLPLSQRLPRTQTAPHPEPPFTPQITNVDVTPLAPSESNFTPASPDRPLVLPDVCSPVAPSPPAVPSIPVPAPLKPRPLPVPLLEETSTEIRINPPAPPSPPSLHIAPPPAYDRAPSNSPSSQNPDHPWEAHTPAGWLLGRLYEDVCTPFPEYDPHWRPVADAAFFVEGVRPVTQVRLRWDGGFNTNTPDRAEYFSARADGNGRGPNPTAVTLPGGQNAESQLTYHEVSVYSEVALGNTGVFLEAPYRMLSPESLPHADGFSDLNVGTKTLLFDCDLFQIGFLFRTYAPTGNAGRGLGTGHPSLEPAFLLSVRLASDMYFQGELAEWIPLGGDADYMGSILHYHLSINDILCRLSPHMPVVGTFEVNGWSFQGGAYTDPTLGTQRAAGGSYISVGPGLRMYLNDQLDFGVGSAFAVTQQHFADQFVRTELRWRF